MDRLTRPGRDEGARKPKPKPKPKRKPRTDRSPSELAVAACNWMKKFSRGTVFTRDEIIEGVRISKKEMKRFQQMITYLKAYGIIRLTVYGPDRGNYIYRDRAYLTLSDKGRINYHFTGWN